MNQNVKAEIHFINWVESEN